ncbi:MAG: hypothetical protein ABWX89_12080 [Paeniglutamicibacter terrestris]
MASTVFPAYAFAHLQARGVQPDDVDVFSVLLASFGDGVIGGDGGGIPQVGGVQVGDNAVEVFNIVELGVAVVRECEE